MELPTQVTIRDIPHSFSLETHIREKAQKLEIYCDRIMACRVVVEQAQKHRHQGKLYTVRIDISTPGRRFAVTHNQDEDVYVALRDSFEDARRQLEAYNARLHYNTAAHHPKIPQHGRIERLFLQQGYGFIEAEDGHEVYFNECTVLQPPFEKLKVGTRVHFLEEMGNKGPQACRVRMDQQYH